MVGGPWEQAAPGSIPVELPLPPAPGLCGVLRRAGMPKPPQVSGQCTQESVVLSVCLHLLQPGSEEGSCAVKAAGGQGGCQALATGAVCWAKRWAGGSTQALPAVTHKVTVTAGEVALPGRAGSCVLGDTRWWQGPAPGTPSCSPGEQTPFHARRRQPGRAACCGGPWGRMRDHSAPVVQGDAVVLGVACPGVGCGTWGQCWLLAQPQLGRWHGSGAS